MEGYKFVSECLIFLSLSVHTYLDPGVEYSPFVSTCGHHSHSKLWSSLFFVSAFATTHSTSAPLPPIPDIRWPNINVFHEIIVKNVKN